MKIFLTGGSGFVGQHLIPKLIAGGHDVVALARSERAAEAVRRRGAEAVFGDLLALGQEVESALTDCEAVVHAAAHMDFTYDPKPFFALNVDATKRLLELAQTAGVSTFIYISAAPVVADSPAVRLTEQAAGPGLPSELYPKTKALAERRVLAANTSTFRALALRPPAIWGPNNPHFEDLFANVKQGKWRWIGGGKQVLSTLHVDNLAAAVIAALTTQAGGGEAFFVTDGDRRAMRTTFEAMFAAMGLNGGTQTLPRGVAAVVAQLTEWTWKGLRLRSRPPLAPLMIRLMATEFSVDDRKAQRILGYRPVTSFAEGISGL